MIDDCDLLNFFNNCPISIFTPVDYTTEYIARKANHVEQPVEPVSTEGHRLKEVIDSIQKGLLASSLLSSFWSE